jgi:hypothetical protein
MSGETDLTSMTVSLPTSQKAYVRAQAAASGCSAPSDHIRRLIHADQRVREQEELERKILEGLGSQAREMTAENWRGLRTALREQLARRRGSRQAGRRCHAV